MQPIYYISSRGNSAPVMASEAILRGIAPDGGLYLPQRLPTLTEADLTALLPLSYPERAAKILSLYLTDYTEEELLADCKAAYSERFVPAATGIHPLREGVSVLELWHGPTCAFKDMALQIMPRLLSRALDKTGEALDALILVATSGDTGKAALEGFQDVPRTSIRVFYPVDGVSRTQKQQMATQEGENVAVTAIYGNFDDAQSGVKQIFADPAMKEELAKQGKFLSSANSINWGRLAPQIVYYVSAYCDLVNAGSIRMGDILDITVPTGNFGNILAAWLAKGMGVPLGKLVCASNSNNVLTDFLSTGTYDRNRPFHTTVSPSMDILISSNLERLLYFAAGAERCAAYMQALSTEGKYTVDADVFEIIRRDFDGDYCSEEACLDRIASTFANYNYLLDPHTAVAVTAAERYLCGNESTHILVVSTASPYKFTPAVARALGLPAVEDEQECMNSVANATGTTPLEPLTAVFTKPVRFTKVIDKADMAKDVLRM